MAIQNSFFSFAVIVELKNASDMSNSKQTRPAKSKFEVDALPPFGKPEVNLKGEAATKAGAILAFGLLAINLITKK